MTQITEEAILAALSTVQEPELHQDLVTLNMIRELEIKGDTVSFTVMLTTPACPLRGRIDKESREAVMAVPGVKTVEIKMDSDVQRRSHARTGQYAHPQCHRGRFGQGRGVLWTEPETTIVTRIEPLWTDVKARFLARLNQWLTVLGGNR